MKCVRLCQCEEDIQHVSSALLESWTGTHWNEVALLTFTEGVSLATISPLSETSKQQCPTALDLEAPSDKANAESTGQNGEEYCEEQIGADQARCEEAEACCAWNEGTCWSAIVTRHPPLPYVPTAQGPPSCMRSSAAGLNGRCGCAGRRRVPACIGLCCERRGSRARDFDLLDAQPLPAQPLLLLRE